MKLTGASRSTTLTTTNPTWTDLGSSAGLRGERPATNRLSHGTAVNPFAFVPIRCRPITVARIYHNFGNLRISRIKAEERRRNSAASVKSAATWACCVEKGRC
jgi:hypothetical protein